MDDELVKKGVVFSSLQDVIIVPDSESESVQLTDQQKEKMKFDYEEQIKQEKYKSSGVGEKYLNKTLDDYDCYNEESTRNFEKVKTFIADVRDKKKKRTLWLCGNSGTGKTLLASLIIRECGGKFVKSYQILNELDDCKSFKAKESKSDIINRYASYDILVIDEIAKFESKQEIEYLFMILNERYEKMKTTIIVTNKSAKELREYLGKPIYDRFVENCMSIEFTNQSYRIKERDYE